MADDLTRLIADLKKLDGSKAVLKEVRRTIRGPLPATRRAIKAAALGQLPARGGLNAWVAATRVTAQIRLSTRSVRIRLKGGRNSGSRKRSDIQAIDRGRVRHPSWGRRGPGDWHQQQVPPGFFTRTVEDQRSEFVAAVDRGASIVAERVNRG